VLASLSAADAGAVCAAVRRIVLATDLQAHSEWLARLRAAAGAVHASGTPDWADAENRLAMLVAVMKVRCRLRPVVYRAAVACFITSVREYRYSTR
jgi:hypothetical protein